MFEIVYIFENFSRAQNISIASNDFRVLRIRFEYQKQLLHFSRQQIPTAAVNFNVIRIELAGDHFTEFTKKCANRE